MTEPTDQREPCFYCGETGNTLPCFTCDRIVCRKCGVGERECYIHERVRKLTTRGDPDAEKKNATMP